jgi:hypothetical protein
MSVPSPRLTFTPCAHHSSIITGNYSDLVYSMVFQLVQLVDIGRHMLKLTARREGAGHRDEGYSLAFPFGGCIVILDRACDWRLGSL